MSSELFISLFLFVIIAIIAANIVYSLYHISREDTLVKLLTYYFILEFCIYLMATIFYFLKGNYYGWLNVSIFRIAVLVPKAAVMIKLLKYINSSKIR